MKLSMMKVGIPEIHVWYEAYSGSNYLNVINGMLRIRSWLEYGLAEDIEKYAVRNP